MMSCPPHRLRRMIGGHMASMLFSDHSVDRTGMVRKPPKKVVDLAAYERSDKCIGGS